MFIFYLLKTYFLFFMFLVLFFFFSLVFKKFKNFVGWREKSSAFECGFDGKALSRTPFSLRFFLILILFLIFDMEIMLVLQFPLLSISVFSLALVSLNSFLMVLFLGTVEEWRRGFLKWACE